MSGRKAHEAMMDALHQQHDRRMHATDSIAESTLRAVTESVHASLKGNFQVIACSAPDVLSLLAVGGAPPDACIVVSAPNGLSWFANDALSLVFAAARAQGLCPSAAETPETLQSLLQIPSADKVVGVVLLDRPPAGA